MANSPFARSSSSTPYAPSHSFPSTSFSIPSTSSPYVTDQPRLPPSSPSSLSLHSATDAPSVPASGGKLEGRAQTLEEMYSVPENYLEIEVREPRTQGELFSLPHGQTWECWGREFAGKGVGEALLLVDGA